MNERFMPELDEELNDNTIDLQFVEKEISRLRGEGRHISQELVIAELDTIENDFAALTGPRCTDYLERMVQEAWNPSSPIEIERRIAAKAFLEKHKEDLPPTEQKFLS